MFLKSLQKIELSLFTNNNTLSDTNHDPITHWDIVGTITQDGSITVSGVLTDNESKIKRWVVAPFASPPAYSEVNGLWTVLATPNATTNFSYSVTLAPPNSQKTLYVWAVDIVGNVGKHMISTDLNVAAYVSPTLLNTYVIHISLKESQQSIRIVNQLFDVW